MAERLLASIIIDNYNYGRFLKDAINSALSQTYQPLEVIVVDDGSIDNSRAIIESYGDKIFSIFKENGGQASAFNAGFNKSRGDIILFLDADDLLYPTALEKVIPLFTDKKIAKVHWSLAVINEAGILTNEVIPNHPLPEGNFREHALRNGPPFFLNPPTSGNAWSRSFIYSILPMPEKNFIIGADTYFFEMVALFGAVKTTDEIQGAYRIHGRNNYNNKSFIKKLGYELKFYDDLIPLLANYCEALGLKYDAQLWRDKSWFHLLQKAIEDIKNSIPEDSTFVLVDDSSWDIGNDFEGYKIHPFTEKYGKYGGAPSNNAEAISELTRMCDIGADYIVFAWSCFWWLSFYSKLNEYLTGFECIIKNERVVIFKLKTADGALS